MNKKQIFDRIYKGVCYYCGVDLPEKYATIDHVIPKFRGGKNVVENFVIACSTCNTAKGSRTIGEFMPSKRRWRVEVRELTLGLLYPVKIDIDTGFIISIGTPVKL